jgi:hypothetical protein
MIIIVKSSKYFDFFFVENLCCTVSCEKIGLIIVLNFNIKIGETKRLFGFAFIHPKREFTFSDASFSFPEVFG